MSLHRLVADELNALRNKQNGAGRQRERFSVLESTRRCTAPRKEQNADKGLGRKQANRLRLAETWRWNANRLSGLHWSFYADARHRAGRIAWVATGRF